MIALLGVLLASLGAASGVDLYLHIDFDVYVYCVGYFVDCLLRRSSSLLRLSRESRDRTQRNNRRSEGSVAV